MVTTSSKKSSEQDTTLSFGLKNAFPLNRMKDFFKNI